MPTVLTLAAWILAAASLAGMVYQLTATVLLRRFLAAPTPPPARRPSVSLLKPLSGNEPHLVDNLRGFCRQNYPDRQIVFGVADARDPALSAVAALALDLADDDKAVVIDPKRHGANLKVGNLINMVGQARGEILVIADSDVRVDPDYLDHVVAPFADPTVGLVTCLYVGRPTEGLWSRVGAMGLNHGFMPSALVARALGRADGSFGATMALPRALLDRIGGLPRSRIPWLMIGPLAPRSGAAADESPWRRGPSILSSSSPISAAWWPTKFAGAGPLPRSTGRLIWRR